FFYTYFEKRQYKRHFTKYIKANYNSEIGVNTTIELNDEGVSIAVGEAKTTMPWTEIEAINETGTLILIEEKNQNAIVIPKQKTSGITDLIGELKGTAGNHSIPYTEDLNWKWK
ncbi:MAG: YcxB family protein, partial [Saprospiraceae bacterium]